jgi:tetratricopeptide (TPR) repeat protein
MSRGAGVWVASWALVGLLAWSGTATAAPAKDRREMQAREAFAGGHYQDALDIYVKLYAEKLHPNYLRNIGRCYQNLGDPEKAISSFREYLRKARKLAAGERDEIEGYIREMQQLQQTRAGAASTPIEPKPEPPPLLPAAAVAPPVQLQAAAPPPGPVAEPPPLYKRWWFWSAVGAAVVGGTVAILLVRGGNDQPSCEAGRQCQ